MATVKVALFAMLALPFCSSMRMKLASNCGAMRNPPKPPEAADSAAVPAISAAESSICTVQGQENARWYQVGSAAGKTMTAEVPENAMFTVYDANLQMVASSWIYGDTSVTLPDEGGWIVFAAGDTARFAITME